VFAVVRSGGKQYRVEEGTVLTVPRMSGEPGSTITLDDVLLVADGEDVRTGGPAVEGAKVMAEVVGHDKGRKVRVLRYKDKTRQRKLTGQRARLTTLRITRIEV
jgi:large subunit ribosomal protein L21